MEFDGDSNVHCALRLETGREILLDRFIQTRIYAGALMGAPNKAANDRDIQQALESAKQETGFVPYLIEPQRRDYRREPGHMQTILTRQRDEPEETKYVPEWLPEIECLGVFRSMQPARDKSVDASALAILWYQDEFGIDDAAMVRLHLVDWDKHATDFDPW